MARKELLPEWIREEAKRCGNCEHQCSNRVGVPFHDIFGHLKKGDLHSAKRVLIHHDPLPTLSSHTCYKHSERACPHKLRIKDTIREVAKRGVVLTPKPRKHTPAIAIIGAGLSGLAMASIAQSKGFEVHLFEAMPQLGGSTRYLTPEWRLPRADLDAQIKELSDGIEIYTNAVIGSTVFVEELAREFDVVAVCTGSNRPAFPGIPGESLRGVFAANDILLGHDTGEPTSTIVLGHGTPALDAAIIEARKGAQVTVVCNKENISADKSLLDAAR
ncbi:FAD-dependent oxidoreductase, partial [Candidatus Woesearchaeota archaeon]|nr:FAD-dependent oxidoreductase [Candidatus Woesearchaeota archaeon]